MSDASELTWHSRPTLRRPLFLAGFAGYFDIAETATAALRHLRRTGGPR